MKTFITIAWRNIIRNRTRSLITTSAIAFGLTALIFIKSFVIGADYQMMENYTDLISGHVQIHKDGFHKKMGLERSIEEVDQLEKNITALPDVFSYTKRVKENVLASSAEQSAGILLVGVDPSTEPRVTDLHKKIKAGRFVEQDTDIVLGKDLVDILHIEMGDKVVVMGQAADGSLAAEAFRLCGVLDTGAEEADKALGLITLSSAQELLVLGPKVSEFVIKAESLFKVDALTEQLKANIDNIQYEILPWQEVSPAVAQWVEFDRAFLNVLVFIIVLVVAAGIMNTILMGVMERIREFGIMLALGTKRAQVILMVTLEAFFLGLLGVLAGTTFGLALTYFFGQRGVDLSAFSSSFEAYYVGSNVYPRILWGDIIETVLVILLISTCASIYPAFKAANLKPIEAIRHF